MKWTALRQFVSADSKSDECQLLNLENFSTNNFYIAIEQAIHINPFAVASIIDHVEVSVLPYKVINDIINACLSMQILFYACICMHIVWSLEGILL